MNIKSDEEHYLLGLKICNPIQILRVHFPRRIPGRGFKNRSEIVKTQSRRESAEGQLDYSLRSAMEVVLSRRKLKPFSKLSFSVLTLLKFYVHVNQLKVCGKRTSDCLRCGVILEVGLSNNLTGDADAAHQGLYHKDEHQQQPTRNYNRKKSHSE